jgi:hypothetical protein
MAGCPSWVNSVIVHWDDAVANVRYCPESGHADYPCGFFGVILQHQGVFETDNEVNADLLAFIKEAIIAIRGRLQAWST